MGREGEGKGMKTGGEGLLKFYFICLFLFIYLIGVQENIKLYFLLICAVIEKLGSG